MLRLSASEKVSNRKTAGTYAVTCRNEDTRELSCLKAHPRSNLATMGNARGVGVPPCSGDPADPFRSPMSCTGMRTNEWRSPKDFLHV